VTRVPLDIAAAIGEVNKATIRQWVNRGVINRYTDGYEVAEILLWVDQERNSTMLQVRMGLTQQPSNIQDIGLPHPA